jgi:DNA-binding GntR family transcriptional regulator
VAGLSLDRASTGARLADALRAELLSGALAPGAPLRDTELARRAGVSRGTAREALAELARDGLVVQTPHRGVRVASPSAADVADLYAARRVLEGAGLGALLRTRPVGLEPLAAAVARLQSARDVAAGVEADAAFHLALVAAAGVDRLTGAAARALSELRLVLCAADRATADLRAQAGEHRVLLRAFAEAPPRTARQALAAHLASGEARALSVVADR